MKKIIFSSLFALPFLAGAQGVDSTKLPMSITLTKDQHKHAIRSLGTGSMSTPDRINYLNDLVSGGIKAKADTAKITVEVPAGLIVDVFRSASQKSEGIVVNDNASAQVALFPQIQSNSWVLSAILTIKAENARTNQAEKDQVESYLQKINSQ